MIGRCSEADLASILEVVNDAASAYRGVIPADCWHEPYMPEEELRAELAAGVVFWGWKSGSRLEGVMGLQPVAGVALIRHAYTRTASRGRGIGAALLEKLKSESASGERGRPVLVGTWKAAGWAVRFYEKRGFVLTSNNEKAALLRRYWNVPERQIEESVVLKRR